jgi:hypothetical protein
MIGKERALSEIQDAKRGLLTRGSGSVGFTYGEAARALSISQRFLKEILGKGNALVIRSDNRGGVDLSIKEWYPGRDLWHEVVQTLAKGRQELSRQRDLYNRLFVACKLIIEKGGDALSCLEIDDKSSQELVELISFVKAGGNPDAMDIEISSLMTMAQILYSAFPRGTQEEIRGQARSPVFMTVQG